MLTYICSKDDLRCVEITPESLSLSVLVHLLFMKVHLSSLEVVLLASVPTASHLVSGDYGNVTVETFGFSISLRVFSELCYFVDILGGLGIVQVFERQHFKTKCKHQLFGKR